MRGHPFLLFLSPGRTGTRFLFNIFQTTYPKYKKMGHIYHESLSPRESLPRRFFRPYESDRQRALRQHPPVNEQISRWHRQLKDGPVLEFGWTVSHLAPFLKCEFPDRLRVVQLYRHPVMFAASRATMGFYQGRYESSEKFSLSPFDPHVINQQFRDRWGTMTPFERCLFFWLEYLQMGQEFREKHSNIESKMMTSETLFEQPRETVEEIAAFAELQTRTISCNVGKNSINNPQIERYPLGKEWRRYQRHPEFLHAGENLGYNMNEKTLAPRMDRYKLPDNLASKLRHFMNYWSLKSTVKDWVPFV